MLMQSINTKDRSSPRDMMALLLLALALFSSSLPVSQADVFLYGARHEVVSGFCVLCLHQMLPGSCCSGSLHGTTLPCCCQLPAAEQHAPGAAGVLTVLLTVLLLQPHYGYGYVGLDWPEEYATCSGTMQSPINVPGHTCEFAHQAVDSPLAV